METFTGYEWVARDCNIQNSHTVTQTKKERKLIVKAKLYSGVEHIILNKNACCSCV